MGHEAGSSHSRTAPCGPSPQPPHHTPCCPATHRPTPCRYFKQQEITLFRKAPDTEAEIAAHSHAGPPKLASINYRAPILSPNGSTSGALPAPAHQPALVQPPPPPLAPAPLPPAPAAAAAPPPAAAAAAAQPAVAPAAAADGPLSSAAAAQAPTAAAAGGEAAAAPLQLPTSQPAPAPSAVAGDLLGGALSPNGGVQADGAAGAAPAAAAAGGAAAAASDELTFGDGDSKPEGIL